MDSRIIIDKDVRNKRGGIMVTLRWYPDGYSQVAAGDVFDRHGYRVEYVYLGTPGRKYGVYAQYVDGKML
jgi:hypothetical protein